MPSSAQEAYFALRAFNVEIASIKDASQLIGGKRRSSRGGGAGGGGSSQSQQIGNTTFNEVVGYNDNDEEQQQHEGSDPSLASKLRMQWWKDAILEIYDVNNNNNNSQQQEQKKIETKTQSTDSIILSSLTSSRKYNPTLRSLAHTIHVHNLTHRFIRRIIEAREHDLNIVQYNKLINVAQYGEDTISNILYLTLETLGIRDDNVDKVMSDVGVGLGIITALRSTGYKLATQTGECSIPVELSIKYNVDIDTLWKVWDVNKSTKDAAAATTVAAQEALRSATIEMVELATFHLHRARDSQSIVPPEGRMCLLPAVCGLHYLDTLKNECDYNVLHPSLVGGVEGGGGGGIERRRRLGLMFVLGRTWLTGTF